VAVKIRPTQKYGFGVRGSIRSVQQLHLVPTGEYTCPDTRYSYLTTVLHGSLPGGFSFEIGVGGGSNDCFLNYSGLEDCMGGICEGGYDVTASCSVGINAELGTPVIQPIAHVGCQKVDCGQWACPICVGGDHDESVDFDVYIEFDADTWFEITDINRSAIVPCLCDERDANGEWYRWNCSDLWCLYSAADKDPCWIPPQKGTIWISTVDNPEISYTISVGGSIAMSGTYSLSYPLINPAAIGAQITSFVQDMAATEECGHVSFYRTGGLASPNWPECVYTKDGDTTAKVSGDTLTIYAVPNIESQHTEIGMMTDYCGSYTHTYNGDVRYVDGPQITGANLQTQDCVPTWDETAQAWGCNTDSNWDSPASETLTFGGWWRLDGVVEGPYVRSVGGIDFAEYKAVNVFDRSGEDDLGDWYRRLGPVWISNPGEFGQPDYPCTNPNHPNEANGCAHNDYHDRRVLAKIGESSVSWDALRFSLQSNHVAYSINREITAQAGADSFTINNLSDVSLWGSRYISLEFTSDDSSNEPFTLVLDGKEYEVKSSSEWIDLLAPTNYTGCGASDSLIPTTRPETAAHGTSVPWDLGVYRVNSLTVKGLKAGCSYSFTSITRRKKSKVNGGSFVVLVLPQASWVGVSAGNTRNPEVDSFVAEDAGISPTLHHNPHVYWQPSGLIFVDGMLAGEIIQAKFLKTPDEPCGDQITTGDVWSVVPMLNDTGDYSAYPGGSDSIITVEVLDTPTGCSNLIAYLDPGLYGDYGETEDITQVTVSAQLRLDWLELPYMFGSYTFDTEKYYGGLLAMRVIGENAPYDVTVTQGTDSQQLTTNECGFALTWGGSTHALQNSSSVQASVGIGTEQVTGLTQIRNRKCSILTLRAGEQSAAIEDCDIKTDTKTRVSQMAYASAGSIRTMRSFDDGISSESAKLVTSGPGAGSPCIIIDNSPLHRTGIIWHEGDIAKIAWSTDGFTTREELNLMTGITHLRAVVNQYGVMVIIGWRSSDGALVAVQSFDYGITVSTPVVIDILPEQSAGLSFTGNELGMWVVLAADSNNIFKSFWSNDNGLTWSLASS